MLLKSTPIVVFSSDAGGECGLQEIRFVVAIQLYKLAVNGYL